MAEPAEELEPLFDYSRVQPCALVDLDDDDDSSILIPSKRRKSSDSTVDKVQDNKKVVDINDVDNDDLDWLDPPPKVVVDKAKLSENSTIKELRLKKQELLSMTESAKDMFKTVEETVKRDLKASLDDTSSESPIEKPLKPAVERKKIVISIQDKTGLKQFRVYMDDKFERLFKMYAEKVNQKVENLVFRFDGDKIDPTKTPSSLDLEDDDLIEVNLKSS